MLDQTDSMELDESRTAKPLARPRGSASTSSAEGGANTSAPPDTDDANYPHLPSTPEKPPSTRQRRTSRANEPDATDVAAQLALHALTDAEPRPRARRSIGVSDDDTEAETIAPKAVPEGALQVRSRRLQRTRSDASLAHTSQKSYCQLAHEPITVPSEQPETDQPLREIEQTAARDTRPEHAATPPTPKAAHKQTCTLVGPAAHIDFTPQ